MASLKASNCAPEKPFVALVLQGGGALGAYHVGAYEALQEAGGTRRTGWPASPSARSIPR